MQIISITTLVGHRDGHPPIGILKSPYEIVIFIIECQQCRKVFPKILLDDRAVYFLGDASVKRLGDVVYLCTVRECGIGEGSEGVVAVGVAAAAWEGFGGESVAV